jgi:cellulose synthase/poly-beta-1,6-N-acetylglucosamine synthase-like glycosyltransferase
MNDLSVIIATKNEENYIGKTLTCLRLCMEEANKHDINVESIVVDSSNDETLKIAKKFADKTYSFPIQGVSCARNYGCKFAKGKILVFMDADTLLLDEKTLVSVYNSFLNPKTVCALTYVSPIRNDLFLWQKIIYACDKIFIKTCGKIRNWLKVHHLIC